MPRLHLVRHAEHALQGRVLVGRAPDVPLSPEGGRQAERLAGRLAALGIAAVHTSPLERARQTAEPIARRLGLPVTVAEALNELDCGDWTGRRFDDLAALEPWRLWNTARSLTRIPGGETMLEVQARVVGFLVGLPDRRAVLVSHGDVIRAALVHLLGMPIDLMLRLEVDPASVSVVELEPWGARVLRVNEAG